MWELALALVIIVVAVVALYGGAQRSRGRLAAREKSLREGAERRDEVAEVLAKPIPKGSALLRRMRARRARAGLPDDPDE